MIEEPPRLPHISTGEQNLDLQRDALAEAGCAEIREDAGVSGSARGRPGLAQALELCAPGDVLTVWRLDRLGRDAIDVASTVARLEEMGVRVHCLALGGTDLTSSAGRMTMGVIGAVAQFERDLLIERTQSGLARARAEGKRIGRPHALPEAARAAVREGLAAGRSVSALAREHGTSRQTIMRVRDGARAMRDEGGEETGRT